MNVQLNEEAMEMGWMCESVGLEIYSKKCVKVINVPNDQKWIALDIVKLIYNTSHHYRGIAVELFYWNKLYLFKFEYLGYESR